jgi:alpha-tubulin suppressor-like RCC1 family protein
MRRGHIAIALFAAVATGCGGGDHADASKDASVDRGPDDAAADRGAEAAGGDGAPDLAIAPACAGPTDCPPEHFCGAATRTCVSAVTQVVAGAHHGCALHRSGAVSCWGLAESIRGGGAEVVLPARVPAAAGATALVAGIHTTCAVTGDRRVRCWGNQDFVPVREDGGPIEGVTAVALGPAFGCAANPQGIHCWGKNEFGQLGRPLDLRESNAAVLADAGARRFLSAGQAVLTHDGADRLCAWGWNGTHLVTTSDDVAVYPRPQCWALAEVIELAVGVGHACVRHGGGGLRCWGERYYGQLGIGGSDTADVPPPGAVTALRAPVVGVVAGANHTCALLSDGAVSCFGINTTGQVGPAGAGMPDEVRDAVTVTGFSGKVVALGAGSNANHTCAILADGSVECWGGDHAGQLGDGPSTVDLKRLSRAPVRVRW